MDPGKVATAVNESFFVQESHSASGVQSPASFLRYPFSVFPASSTHGRSSSTRLWNSALGIC